MEKMSLFLIVCDHVLNEVVHDMLHVLGVGRLIKIDEVHGEWKEKHLCTHVWPGEYHAIMTGVPEEKVQAFKEEIEKIRKRFPADEIWAWKLPLEETI